MEGANCIFYFTKKTYILALIKLILNLKATTQDLLQFCSTLNQMSHSPWVKKFQHIGNLLLSGHKISDSDINIFII